MPPTTGARPPGRRELKLPPKLTGKLLADAIRIQDDFNSEICRTYQGSPIEHGWTHGVTASDPLPLPLIVPKLVMAGTSPAIGVGPSYMREDAQLAAETGTPTDLGEANAEGSGTALARATHVHKLLVRAAKAGVTTGTRKRLNFTDTASFQFNLADDAVGDEIDISGTVLSAPAHNLLSATHPDTTPASPVRGDLLIGIAGPSWSKLAIGTSGKFLRTDGTDPSWQNIAASDITSGILTLARGGTGADLSGTGGAGFFIKQSSVGANFTSAALVLGDISDGLITYAKLQDVSAASKILGRGDSGSGGVQEITVGSGLAMTGTTLSATGGGGGAPTTVEYLVGALDAGLSAERLVTDTATLAWDLSVAGQAKANVPNDAITYAKLQNLAGFSIPAKATSGAGDAADLTAGDETVLGRTAAGNLAFAALATGQIANDAVTYAKLQNVAGFSVPGKATSGSGDAADITAGDETVFGRTGAGNLGFAQLATGQVANQAITYAKIQDVSAGARVLGRTSVGGAGVITELTGTQLQSIIGSPSFVKDANTTVAAASDLTWLVLAANSGDITGVAQTVVMTITGVGVGRYHFRCQLIYQTTNTGTGIDVSANHTGTTTQWVIEHRFASTGQLAGTAAASEAAASAVGNLYEAQGNRTKNTIIGAGTVSVDAANTDMISTIEGFFVVSVSGDFQIKMAAEAAGLVCRAMQGSHLELMKLS